MKKIVIDSRFWGPKYTGLGRYTQSLVSALYQLKPKFDITLLIRPRDKRLITKAIPKFDLVTVSADHYSIKEQLYLPSLLKSLKPDLVHFPHFNVPMSYSGNYVVTIHDLIKHHSTGLATTTRAPFIYLLKVLGYRLVVNRAINRSKALIVPSNWVKQDILKFYSVNSSKITITPEAPAKIYLKKTRFPLNYSVKKPYCIYVGNAYPHKNLIQLIKAVEIANRSLSDNLQLIIVTGRGVFLDRLKKLVNQLEAKKFTRVLRFVTDKQLKTLYQDSVCFITTSLLEGFGLPGLEALAAGTLVLASNKAALPEVYGQSATWFNPENPQDIAQKLIKAANLSSKKRQQLISKGQIRAQTFSWGSTAEKTLKVYQNLL